MPKRFFKAALLFLALFAALSVAYWPAIFSQYLYHDDVVYFMTTPTRLEPPGSLFNVAIGRFLGGNMLIALGFLVKTMSDLNTIRFLSVVELSMCGFLFVLWSRRHFLSLPASFLIAIATFTLPPFQIMVSQAGMGFQPMGILFAVLSAIFAYRISIEGYTPKRFFNKNAYASMALFLSAISVYQPAGMFFWAMLGFALLFSPESFKDLRARVFNFAYVGFIVFGLYGVILHQTKKFFMKFNLWAYNPYSLTTDYAGKIKWFFSDPLVSALNLWNIFPQTLYANLLFGFICMAAGLKIFRMYQARALDGKKVVFIFVVLSVLVFASFLPNLASENNIFFYRCAPGLMALVLFFVLASCREYSEWGRKINKALFFSVVLSGFVLCGIVLAFQTIVHHRIVPSQREWSLFFNTIVQSNINQYKIIYVIEPQEEHLRHRGDEYRNLTTRYSHNMVGLLSCALREMAKGKMRVVHIGYDEAAKKVLFVFEDLKNKGVYLRYETWIESGPALDRFEEGTLVIDMRPLHDF
ncbi:MAG: hypothetical protein WCX16_06715 [Candidatus Omnitrophota bacterium]